ncbi:MAG: hypothetical protein ACE5KZ_12285 [Candidatus Scalinduaceae bacterium]
MSTQQIAIIIAAGVAIWVYIDAQKNGYSTRAAIGWLLGVFLLMIVFLPAYFIMKARRAKSPEILTPCEFCGKHYHGKPNYCPHCGHMVRKYNP